MSDKPPVLIRQAVPEDIPFIMNSWLKSYRDSVAVRGVPNDIYYKAHHAVIERLVQKPCATALVVCDPEDSNQIYGWVAAEYIEQGLVIHFVYVKYQVRGFGLARELIQSLMLPTVKWVQFSHKGRVVDSMAERITKMGLVFNPYHQIF